jgi:ABC-type oligopeptide transport system substrate-binding subunit
MIQLLPSLSARAADRELRLPLVQEPGTLDVQRAASDTDFDILRDLFEGLVTRGPDGEVRPGVALRWETAPDGLSWTFHLRPDETWSDGSPFTAADFVYSFRREVDPATAAPFAETLTPIAGAAEIIAGSRKPDTLGVAAPDPATLVITLAEPTPWLLALLGNYSALPVPRRAIERFGAEWTRPGNIVGNGAYVLTNWVPFGGVTLARNPAFHDAATVRIAQVRRVPVGDPNTGLRQWEAGELDVAAVPYDQLERMRQAHPEALHVAPWLATQYLDLNLDRPELQDVRVRRALAMVIDRAVIAEKLQHGGALPAESLIPPNGFPGYEPPRSDWAALPMAARIEAARQLMRAARGPDAPPLRLAIRMTKVETSQRIAQAIAGMWAQALGVETTLDTSEARVWLADMLQRNYQVALDAWDADYLDPWSYLENFRSSSLGMNFTRYRSQVYDDLLERSRSASDAAARMGLMEQAEATLLADQPIIPIEFRLRPALTHPQLGGWSLGPIDIHLSRDLWWEE